MVYLASPAWRFNGEVFGVDGGTVVRYQPWSPLATSHSASGWTLDEVADVVGDLSPI